MIFVLCTHAVAIFRTLHDFEMHRRRELLQQRNVVRARRMRRSHSLELTRALPETCQQNSAVNLEFPRPVIDGDCLVDALFRPWPAGDMAASMELARGVLAIRKAHKEKHT